jgi:hypothetical protein
MRAIRTATAGVLLLILSCTVQAGPRARWKLDIPDPDVPHDPLCDKLQKVVDDYFYRHPKEPAACIQTALGGAFDLPAWQPLAYPGREFAARIEKFSQVAPQTFFADEDAGRPLEDTYFYRADLTRKEGGAFFVWRAEFDDRITPYQSVSGTKTILQYRHPYPRQGCASKPDRRFYETLVLMNSDLSGPLRVEDPTVSSLLIDANLRLLDGQPILINGPEVYRQSPIGFMAVCSFKKKR